MSADNHGGGAPAWRDITLLPRIIWKNRDLFREFVIRNTRQRYMGSVLGNAWGIIHPVMMALIYTFIFGIVFKVSWEPRGPMFSFPVNILCGLQLFSILSESVNGGTSLISRHPNYVKKIVFPLEILPAAHVISAFYYAALWLPIVLTSVLLVYGFHWTMLLFPLLLVPLLCFCLGLCFFVASLGVYFRDVQVVVTIIMQIMFYVSAVIFPLSRLSPKWRVLIRLNPMTVLIDEMRRLFIRGELPDWGLLALEYLLGFIVLHLGFLWFYRTKKGFSDVI